MTLRGVALAGCHILSIFALFSSGTAISAPPASNVSDPWLDRGGYSYTEPRDFYLRIMPLGASITKGWPLAEDDWTQKGNGYRKALRDKLVADNWKVHMVGNASWGSMEDNATEGYPGKRVEEIMTIANASINFWKPNVYLINAGTNDAIQDYQVATIGDRMRALIEQCLNASPEAVVVLSTLLPTKMQRAQENARKINEQYRALVKELAGNDPKKPKAKVVLADMDDGKFLTENDIGADQVHPNFEGFRKMSAVWLRAIYAVNDLGWLSRPSALVSFRDGDRNI